jgi:hypothetical protein
MMQVLDYIRLFEDAQSIGNPHERFDWKLESASTNSPFRVVALAEPFNPTVDRHSRLAAITSSVTDIP